MLLSHKKVEGNFLITEPGDEAIAEWRLVCCEDTA